MNDHTDPLVILAAGDPSIIPPAFVDVLDAIVAVDPGLSSAIDRIIDELTDDHIEIVKTIAALAVLRQAATSHQTFSERRISAGTDTQYAARVSWSNGTDEIHPKTADGTSRFEAERHAINYNTDMEIMGRRRDGMTELLMSSASVVRRTVVYGPWYAV